MADLEKGWITVRIGLPHTGEPPYPVVLSPILPDHELLAHGIGVVRWKTNWSILQKLASPEPTPMPRPTKENSGSEPAGVGAWLLRAPRPGIVGQAYFQLITNESHRSLPAVLDHLRTSPDVDASRIAITGSSTSGFTALQALAEHPELAAGVVQVACGDYRRFLKSSQLALGGQERWLEEGEIVLDADYEEYIDTIDPIGKADRFPPRPLLLISGAKDRAIPADCVGATAERFAHAYERSGVSNRFEWVEYEERGHNMGPEAPPLILDFLLRWLEMDARLLDSP